MSIWVFMMIMAMVWMHGRFNPWAMEIVRKQKERAFEKRLDKARQKWYGERFNKV
jgi:hypothetical protein